MKARKRKSRRPPIAGLDYRLPLPTHAEIEALRARLGDATLNAYRRFCTSVRAYEFGSPCLRRNGMFFEDALFAERIEQLTGMQVTPTFYRLVREALRDGLKKANGPIGARDAREYLEGEARDARAQQMSENRPPQATNTAA